MVVMLVGGGNGIFRRMFLVIDGVGVFRSRFLVVGRWLLQVGWEFCGGSGGNGSGRGGL